MGTDRSIGRRNGKPAAALLANPILMSQDRSSGIEIRIYQLAVFVDGAEIAVNHQASFADRMAA